MSTADLIIIGNGMACQRLLSELANYPNRPQRILVFGAEDRPAYNRVLLSGLLSNELADSAAQLCDSNWYQQQGIELICDDAIVRIDRERQQVVSRRGRCCRYRQLVIACGARPLTPSYALDAQQQLQNGVCHFRNWQDLQTLRQASRQHRHAVVVGGGFLGLEAAEGLRKLGMQVTLLQRGRYLLNRQLDTTAAELLAARLRQRGLTILTGSEIDHLQHTQQQLSAVQLKNGQLLAAGLVVLALGISPDISLAQQAGLRVGQGIQVNARLQSSDSAIYALGECCELNGETFGLVAPINRQAQVLAAVLSAEAGVYHSEAVSTQLKISGIALSSCGDIAALQADSSRYDATAHYQDQQLGEYRRLWWYKQQLVGAVLYGDTSLSLFYSELIHSGQQCSGDRTALLFGPQQRAA